MGRLSKNPGLASLPFGPVAQSAEQRTFNPKVAGSIPAGPTVLPYDPRAARRASFKQGLARLRREHRHPRQWRTPSPLEACRKRVVVGPSDVTGDHVNRQSGRLGFRPPGRSTRSAASRQGQREARLRLVAGRAVAFASEESRSAIPGQSGYSHSHWLWLYWGMSSEEVVACRRRRGRFRRASSRTGAWR